MDVSSEPAPPRYSVPILDLVAGPGEYLHYQLSLAVVRLACSAIAIA